MPNEDITLSRLVGNIEGTMSEVCKTTTATANKVDMLTQAVGSLSSNKVDREACESVQRRQEAKLHDAVGKIKAVVENGNNTRSQKPLLVRAKENIALTVAIITSLGALGTLAGRGIVSLAEAIVDIKRTMQVEAVKREEDSAEIQQLQSTVSSIQSHQPERIYVPIAPDAGVRRYARRRSRRATGVAAGGRRIPTKVVRPTTRRGDAGP